MEKGIRDDAANGKYELLYTTPETIGSCLNWLQDMHTKGYIDLFVVDEAHCISEWGYDFPKAYGRLGTLRIHFPSVQIIALIATATPIVRDDIIVP